MYNLYQINGCEDKGVLEILSDGLSITSSDRYFLENYHPDWAHLKSNLFNLLSSGKFNSGGYIVICVDGKYVGSAGWYEYDDYIIALSRSYVVKKFRGQQLLTSLILPKILNISNIKFKPAWITFNEKNKYIYQGFLRSQKGLATSLNVSWPEAFNFFKPIGLKVVNNVSQYVVEYVPNTFK